MPHPVGAGRTPACTGAAIVRFYFKASIGFSPDKFTRRINSFSQSIDGWKAVEWSRKAIKCRARSSNLCRHQGPFPPIQQLHLYRNISNTNYWQSSVQPLFSYMAHERCPEHTSLCIFATLSSQLYTAGGPVNGRNALPHRPSSFLLLFLIPFLLSALAVLADLNFASSIPSRCY